MIMKIRVALVVAPIVRGTEVIPGVEEVVIAAATVIETHQFGVSEWDGGVGAVRRCPTLLVPDRPLEEICPGRLDEGGGWGRGSGWSNLPDSRSAPRDKFVSRRSSIESIKGSSRGW